MSFLCLTTTFYWFLFFFLPVLCPLFADWALCCMLVVMSQFECSQTVSRTMGIQVNKGKVNPLTHNPPVISQRQPATLLTHTQTRFPIPQSKWEGVLSGREWASSTNIVAEASRDGLRCLCCSVVWVRTLPLTPYVFSSLCFVVLATCSVFYLTACLKLLSSGQNFLLSGFNLFTQR